MKTIQRTILCSILGLFLITACQKPDPHIPNEEELITTLRYILISQESGDTVVFSYVDLDGEGGNPPQISTEPLDTQSTYQAGIELLNEVESPAIDIAEEVREEAEEHQFFYASSVAGLQVSYDDTDGNAYPLGLETALTTSGQGSGELTITLRHEPDKSAEGVADGEIDNAGGETDIELTFDVEVE